MGNTLDDVIKACEKRYGLKVTNKNRSKYVGFLQRQEAREQVAHSKYSLDQQRPHPVWKIFPYLNLMVGKLFLFSYLIGETPIIAGCKGDLKEKRIKSVNDLYLLRPHELGGCIGGDLSSREQCKQIKLRQTDKGLLSLYRSFRSNHNKYSSIWPTWGEAIDELGGDEEVIKHLKTEIDYIMVKRCDSPTLLTFGHGGCRQGESFKRRKFLMNQLIN